MVAGRVKCINQLEADLSGLPEPPVSLLAAMREGSTHALLSSSHSVLALSHVTPRGLHYQMSPVLAPWYPLNPPVMMAVC